MTKVFRKDVPEELILEFLKIVGVSSLNDYHWFPKCILIPFTNYIDRINELLVLLEPYYYPHKIYYVKREMNPSTYIQILRQLIKHKNLKLEAKEYFIKQQNKKSCMYRINDETKMKKEISLSPFIVRFD